MPCEEGYTVPAVESGGQSLPWFPIHGVLHLSEHGALVDAFNAFPAFSSFEFFSQSEPVVIHAEHEVPVGVVPRFSPFSIVAAIPLVLSQVALQSPLATCHGC